ncbi:hypothetical protein [Nocardia abscessus]|uniref:hypothetical protein n=1 Tax=Nocardia abscessus TaxID=120957 RepID=UPI002456B903|nr:hypothetical protein [Nocardia abscessus]
MQAFIISLIFGSVAIACAYAASKGFRGVATSRTEGYGEEIPDTTLVDPVRRRKANRLVAWCEATAAVLCLPPAGYALWVAFDPDGQIPLSVLLGMGVYSIAVFSLAHYPLDKIRQ